MMCTQYMLHKLLYDCVALFLMNKKILYLSDNVQMDSCIFLSKSETEPINIKTEKNAKRCVLSSPSCEDVG